MGFLKFLFKLSRDNSINGTSSGSVLGVSVTNHIYFNFILSEFTKGIALSLDATPAFLNHYRRSVRIRLFSQALRGVETYSIIGGISFLNDLFRAIRLNNRIGTYEGLEKFNIQGAFIGKHIYDYILIRHKKPTLSGPTGLFNKDIIFGLYYYVRFLDMIETMDIRAIVLLDNVYIEGIVFEVARVKGIEMFCGIDINTFAIHRYHGTKDTYLNHCRTPDNEVVDSMVNNAFMVERIENYITDRFEGRETQMDALNAFNQNKKHLDFGELNRGNRRNLVLVLPHIMCDAPHCYSGMPFKDYYQWFVNTLKVLCSDSKNLVLVKEHPSAEFYGEQGLVSDLVMKLNYKNCLMLDSEINSLSLMTGVDYVITCGGTSGMEFAYHGVPVIAASTPPYHSFEIAHCFNNKREYLYALQNLHEFEAPREDKRLLAGTLLYLTFRGFGSKLIASHGIKSHVSRAVEFDKRYLYKFYSEERNLLLFRDVIRREMQRFINSGLANTYVESF